MKKKKIIDIQGTGNETRSFIHIKDFCEAFNILFDRGKHLNIYNIGTEERVKIRKIVRILESHNSLTGLIIENLKIKKNKVDIEFDGMWS